MIYKMTSKVQVKKMTSGQRHSLTQRYYVAHQSIHLDKTNTSNLSQSKAIARELLVTYDDVARPLLLTAEVIGAIVNLNG